MGYPFDKKGWKIYDLETSKYLVSRDVLFVKTNFLYATQVFASDNSTRIINGPNIHKDWETVEAERED